MAKPKRRRWHCGIEDHPAVLAPERMRADNWLRVCVPCSEATGKITHRVCIAAETRRAKKANKKALDQLERATIRQAEHERAQKRRLSQKQLNAATWELCGTEILDIYTALMGHFPARRRAEVGGFLQPVFGKYGTAGDPRCGWRARDEGRKRVWVLVVNPACPRFRLELQIAWRMAYHVDYDGAGLHMMRIAEERWRIPEGRLPAISKNGKVDEHRVLQAVGEWLIEQSTPEGTNPKWLVPAAANLMAGDGLWTGVDRDATLEAVGGQHEMMASMPGPIAIALDRWLGAHAH